MKDFERIDRLEKDFQQLLSAIRHAYLEIYKEGDQKSPTTEISYLVVGKALAKILVKYHKLDEALPK